MTGSLAGRPLLVLAALAAVAGAAASRSWTYLDLTVYGYGGRTVLDGLPLYAGAEPHSGLLFTYPPFAALGFTLFVMPPPWLVAGSWTALSVAALAATFRAFELPRTWLLPVTVAALALDPVRETLMFGQVNLALMALVSYDLLVLRGRWSGYLVGIAAGVKLTPLVFVGLLALVGRRADALRALSAFTATVLVGVVLLPGEPLLLVLWRRTPWTAVPVAVLLLVGLRPLVVHGEKAELTWHGLQQVPGNGYTWLVLLLSFGSAYSLVRERSSRPTQQVDPYSSVARGHDPPGHLAEGDPPTTCPWR